MEITLGSQLALRRPLRSIPLQMKVLYTRDEFLDMLFRHPGREFTFTSKQRRNVPTGKGRRVANIAFGECTGLPVASAPTESFPSDEYDRLPVNRIIVAFDEKKSTTILMISTAAKQIHVTVSEPQPQTPTP